MIRYNRFMDAVFRNWPIKILSVAAAVILFTFQKIASLEERYFTVPLDIKVDDSLIPVGSYPKSARVNLRGTEETIYLIPDEEIEVMVDFSDITAEGVFKSPVQYVKKGAAQYIDALEVKVDPLTVTISLEKKLTKKLNVVPDVNGFPASGYEMTEYFCIPNAVDVTGPRSQLAPLSEIMTGIIDINGVRDDFVLLVPLKLPFANMRILSGNNVEFYGKVSQTLIIKTYSAIDIFPVDLAEGLVIKGERITGNIQVRGTKLVLDKVGVTDISLLMDCSEVNEPGTYTLKIVPVIPFNVELMQYEPETIEITVASRETGE